MSWGDLQAILQEIRETAKAERDRPLIECPLCGEVLDENGKGERNCPLGHFRTTARTHGQLAS